MSLPDGGQRKRIARLYEEACAAMQIENWQEAVYKLDQVMDITPDFPGAEWRHQEAHRWHQINTYYDIGRRHMDAERWSEALQVFRQVQQRVPNYKDTAALMSMCERQMLGRTPSVRQSVEAVMQRNDRLVPAILVVLVMIGSVGLWLASAPNNPQPRNPLVSDQTELPPVAIVVTGTTAATVVNTSSTPTASSTITQGSPSTPGSVPASPTSIVPGITTRPTFTRSPTPRVNATRSPTPRGNSTATPTPPVADTPVITPDATAVGQPSSTPTAVILVSTETPPPTGNATATPSPTPTARAVTVTASEFSFAPQSLTFKAGERIVLTLANRGSIEHHWMLIDSTGKASSPRVAAAAGQNNILVFTAPSAGVYNYICDIADHAQRGMTGRATVQ